jgi:hypothetical protein
MTDRDATIARAVEYATPKFDSDWYMIFDDGCWYEVKDGSKMRVLMQDCQATPIAAAAIEAKIVELGCYIDIYPGRDFSFVSVLEYERGVARTSLSYGPYTDKLFIYSDALCKLLDQMGETPKKVGE